MAESKVGKIESTAVEAVNATVRHAKLGSFLSRHEFSSCGYMGGFDYIVAGMTDTGVEISAMLSLQWDQSKREYNFVDAKVHLSHRCIPEGRFNAPWQAIKVCCRYVAGEGMSVSPLSVPTPAPAAPTNS